MTRKLLLIQYRYPLLVAQEPKVKDSDRIYSFKKRIGIFELELFIIFSLPPQ